MPYNITEATVKAKGLTLMPTYGLNVYSILRHHQLVLTVKSLETIEEKIINYLHNTEFRDSKIEKRL